MNIFKLIHLFSSDFIKNNKKYLILFFIITIIYFCIEIIGISYLINQVLKTPNYQLIFTSIVILISLCLFNVMKGFLENLISSKLRCSSRIKLLNGVIDRFKESYKDVKIGDTVTRIMSVTLEFVFGFNLFIKIILPRVITMTICCVAIFLVHKVLSIFFIITLILMIISSFFCMGTIFRAKEISENTYYLNFDKLSNNYNNLLNTYINNEADNQKKSIVKQQNHYCNKVLISDNTLLLNTSILKVILSLFLLGTIIYIYYNFKSIRVENRSFLGIIIIFYISAALSYSVDSSDFFSHLAICQTSYQQFADLLKKKNSGTKQSIKKGNISVSNLYFSYNKNDPILSNINLNIQDKEKIAILGRSGSGKSTLAKLILKLYPYQGTIKIDNINIQSLDSQILRDKISYVNQRTELLEKSVLQNIEFGTNSSPKEIISILNKYQLQEVFSGLGKGIHEQCLIDGKNLSLGMQKVIILVRGVLKSKNSLVVFFDEPLAALDQKTRKKIIKMIMTECAHKTIIVITHDPEIVPYMNRVYNINEMNS